MNVPRVFRLLEIRKILKAARVNLVHSWTMHTNFYAAMGGRLAGIPIRVGSERCNQHASQKALGTWYNLSLWGRMR